MFSLIFAFCVTCYLISKSITIVYKLFYVSFKNLSLNGDVTIDGERLQNLGLCSPLMTFEKKDQINAIPAATNMGPRFFSVSIKRTATFIYIVAF
jgi:hypothetical protein